MTQLADRHTPERKTVGLAKTSEYFDGIRDFMGGCGWPGLISSRRTRGGILNQTGCVRINPHSTRGSLTRKLGLNLGSTVMVIAASLP